jgi:hypothetical protein
MEPALAVVGSGDGLAGELCAMDPSKDVGRTKALLPESRFQAGLQRPRHLWLEVYGRDRRSAWHGDRGVT